MQKKITIKDIAALSGFSKSTVSRSLNDNPAISRATREKIKEIARQHNFAFNANARSLSLKRNDTIGIISTESPGDTAYVNLLGGMVRRYFGRRGMDALLCGAADGATGESNIRRLIRTAKVSGLFLLSDEISQADWKFLKETPFPLVISHFRPRNATYDEFSSFFADNETGGYLATEALIKAGRKRLLSVGEGGGQLQFLHRTAGYLKALAAYGLESNGTDLIEGECSYAFGYQCIMDRKGLLPRIDGIFAQADIIAAGVLNALKDLSYRVPEDIALIGFDDMEFCRFLRPELATVHQPREGIITRACDDLYAQITEDSPREPVRLTLPPRLILRESCPAPRT